MSKLRAMILLGLMLTLALTSQITITEEDESFVDYQDVIRNIYRTEGVTELSIEVTNPGFLLTEDDSYPIVFRGFDFNDAEGIYEFSERLTKGKLPSDNEVILGVDLNKEVLFNVGDSITLRTALGKEESFRVSGLFDFGVSSLNESWIIGNYQDVQSFFGLGDKITSIEIQVEDVFLADVIAEEVSNKLDSNYVITNWKDENADLLSGLNGQSVSSLMIQVFVIISVVLGIASVLAISVVQKSKQIGILKAMGIKDSTASLIFLLQGFLLGIFGGVLGILLGLGLLYSFTTFALNPDGTPVVPILINNQFMILSAMVAITASTLAALIPARRSSKLNPIEVIKNG